MLWNKWNKTLWDVLLLKNNQRQGRNSNSLFIIFLLMHVPTCVFLTYWATWSEMISFFFFRFFNLWTLENRAHYSAQTVCSNAKGSRQQPVSLCVYALQAYTDESLSPSLSNIYILFKNINHALRLQFLRQLSSGKWMSRQ